MPMSSKFLTESSGEKNVKIGQYLAKLWTKYDRLLFLGHPVCLKMKHIVICDSCNNYTVSGKKSLEYFRHNFIKY